MRNDAKQIEKKIGQIENDFGFDPADVKFLEVAILVNAVIISGDSHFTTLKQNMQTDFKLRGRLRNIRIVTPTEACNYLK